MEKQSILAILALNRRDIQRNVSFSITLLDKLNESYGNETDADVQLSLQLSNSLARFYFYAQYQASIDISSLAIERYGASGSLSFVVMHLNLLGAGYTAIKKHEEAEHYFKEALTLAGNEPSFAHLLVNIYQQMTENCIKQGVNLDAALEYTEKSLELLEKYPRPILKNRVFLQLGNIYTDKENFGLALDYFKMALHGFSNDFEYLLMSLTYISMGRCYLLKNDLALAKQHLQEGLKLGDKAGQPENCAWNNLYLAQVFQKENNMDEALEYASMALHFGQRINDDELIAAAQLILKPSAGG